MVGERLNATNLSSRADHQNLLLLHPPLHIPPSHCHPIRPLGIIVIRGLRFELEEVDDERGVGAEGGEDVGRDVDVFGRAERRWRGGPIGAGVGAALAPGKVRFDVEHGRAIDGIDTGDVQHESRLGLDTDEVHETEADGIRPVRAARGEDAEPLVSAEPRRPHRGLSIPWR